MGACDFHNRVKGKTAQEAFESARQEAGFESGFGGYSGTIVEKNEFQMISVPEGETPESYVRKMNDAWEDESFHCDFNPFEDKWGPAGCIDLGNGEYLFFGSASS